MEKYLLGLLLCSFVNAQTVSVSPFPASLTTQVSGTLPVANGGTGVTTSTGTGNVMLSASPTTSGTLGAAAITATGIVQGVSILSTGTGINYGFITNSTLNTSTSYGYYANNTFNSSVTTAIGYRALLSTQATGFTLTNLYGFSAQDGTKGVGSTITNSHGFNTFDLVNGTNNYGYRGQVTSGTNKYNLYMDGTAQNYLFGKTGIGAVSDGASALNVTGTVTVTGTEKQTHIQGTSSAPTIAAGAGAGTAPTVSVTGNDTAMQVTVTTGTLPTGTNAVVATVTYNSTYASTPHPIFSVANSNSALLSAASMVNMDGASTTTFTITAGTTALTAATTYVWNIYTIN